MESSADIFGHLVQGDTIWTGNVMFVGIVQPGRKDEQTAFGNGIEKEVGGFEILTKTIIGNVYNGVFFLEEDMKHLLLMLGNKRRDHDRALASGENTAVLVITEWLVVAVLLSIFDPNAADMNGAVAVIMEKGDVTHGAVGTTGNENVGLDTEEAGFEALGSETLWIHLHIADHRLQLPMTGKRTDEGSFREERRELPVRLTTDLFPQRVFSAHSRNN